MKNLLLALVLVLVAGTAYASELTLTWNPVDWTCGGLVVRDAATEGYIAYKDGEEIGQTTAENTTLTIEFEKPVVGDFTVLAFNRFGQSAHSVPAYARVTDAPSNLKLFLQELIAFLSGWAGRL